jgi:general secretion pathway protein J
MISARLAGRQNGFTLLEVLVALLVLGLLVVGLSQGVRASLDLRQAQMHRLGSIAELDAVQRLLRGVLGRLPRSADGKRSIPGKNPNGLSGEPDRVTFVGDLPTGLGANRRAEISLYLQGGRLVLSWAPHRHEQSLAPPPQPAETGLLQGVEKLDLAYWAGAASGQTPGWQSRWTVAETPELIRIRLAFGETDRRRWPDLIVAPRP